MCATDGADLGTDDWCPVGQGYPMAARQDVQRAATRLTPLRFERRVLSEVVPAQVCPHCRRRMTWDGGCSDCHGSSTPGDRATWTYPGDRWELDASRHYQRIARGPRPVASEAEAVGVFAALRALRARHEPAAEVF